MSFSLLFRLVGFLNLILAGSMILPLLVDLIYKENQSQGFLTSIAITTASGSLMILLCRGNQKREMTHREGFAIVAFAWLSATFFGSLPYLFTGSLNNFTDAWFETTSGFTTTGSTILTDIERHTHAILFWRSLTQWMGGMGIIVLSLAILPFLGIGGMQLYKAEVPGPTADKLRPRITQTARILWQVYVFLSGIEVLLLFLGGMNLFEALCHTFSTMATGGFSPKNASIEFYQNPFIEYVIIFFMFIAGVNFSLHYRALKGDLKYLWQDEEFCFYLSLTLISTFLITLIIWKNMPESLERAFRLSIFQATSILTTTGFCTTDFEKWPIFSQILLFLLMFFGGCAGSTGGALKCIRIYLIIKQSIKEIHQIIHPHAIIPVKLGGKIISPDTLNGVWALFFIYLIIFVIASLSLALLDVDFLTSISAVAATLGNVGPGLGTVGPAENFAHLPTAAKWILSICMFLGRLEIYTLLVLFAPEFWRK